MDGTRPWWPAGRWGTVAEPPLAGGVDYADSRSTRLASWGRVTLRRRRGVGLDRDIERHGLGQARSVHTRCKARRRWALARERRSSCGPGVARTVVPGGRKPPDL